MRILAIETSHDDTSVVLYQDWKVIKEVSYTQTEFHKKFGGTVPEYAARGHYDKLQAIVKRFLCHNKGFLNKLDYIAYTYAPGLVGSLHMGRLFAEALSLSLNVPLIKVNHMHAHIFAVRFNHEITYPALALVVSGGHTQLWDVQGPNNVNLIGETKDDAVGECYDKVARAMKLGFPGGPIIDSLSKFSKTDLDFNINDDGTYDFSFSGLKTKVINYIHQKNQKKTKYEKESVAHAFQHAAVNILISKTKRAIAEFKPKSIILGGGVSANSHLRSEFAKLHDNALIPALKYTTDNAMMIAITAHLQIEKK